jgi:hypothetical protein
MDGYELQWYIWLIWYSGNMSTIIPTDVGWGNIDYDGIYGWSDIVQAKILQFQLKHQDVEWREMNHTETNGLPDTVQL